MAPYLTDVGGLNRFGERGVCRRGVYDELGKGQKKNGTVHGASNNEDLTNRGWSWYQLSHTVLRMRGERKVEG